MWNLLGMAIGNTNSNKLKIWIDNFIAKYPAAKKLADNSANIAVVFALLLLILKPYLFFFLAIVALIIHFVKFEK